MVDTYHIKRLYTESGSTPLPLLVFRVPPHACHFHFLSTDLPLMSKPRMDSAKPSPVIEDIMELREKNKTRWAGKLEAQTHLGTSSQTCVIINSQIQTIAKTSSQGVEVAHVNWTIPLY